LYEIAISQKETDVGYPWYTESALIGMMNKRMEKKQLWIVGIVAVVAIATLGVVAYRQLSGTAGLIGSQKSLQELTAKEQQTVPKSDGFDSGTLPTVPQSKVSVDGVVAGIASDATRRMVHLEIRQPMSRRHFLVRTTR
jgi:hypothetical protein